MKTEYAWVIQRDDGKFFKRDFLYNGEADIFEYSVSWISSGLKSIVNIYHFTDYDNTKKSVLSIIHKLNLQNCKPVKVELKVVEDA